MYEIKTDFSSNKEMFDFSNYPTKSKYYDGSNKLVIGKMKDETRGVAIDEFVGLKPTKAVNKDVVETISHNEYKHALLNNK